MWQGFFLRVFSLGVMGHWPPKFPFFFLQVSEWNFDPASLEMLLIMAMSSESASVNLRVA